MSHQKIEIEREGQVLVAAGGVVDMGKGRWRA